MATTAVVARASAVEEPVATAWACQAQATEATEAAASETAERAVMVIVAATAQEGMGCEAAMALEAWAVVRLAMAQWAEV